MRYRAAESTHQHLPNPDGQYCDTNRRSSAIRSLERDRGEGTSVVPFHFVQFSSADKILTRAVINFEGVVNDCRFEFLVDSRHYAVTDRRAAALERFCVYQRCCA